MSPALGAAADLVLVAAVVAAGVTLAATRQPRLSAGVLLDLLLAAGLLRLASPGTPGRLAAVAAIVLVRHLIGLRWAALGRIRAATRPVLPERAGGPTNDATTGRRT